jgi:3-dehydrocarnitine:acetyl-CoA trimethylamine transferase
MIEGEQRMNREVFITCAVTGAGDNVRKSTKVPILPSEIAESVREASLAGAAIAHIHVREPATGVGSRRVELYREVLDRIRELDLPIVINLTAGMGGDLVIGAQDPMQFGPETDLVSAMDRLAHVKELLPEICTLDCGSYNVGRGNTVYISTAEQIRLAAERIRLLGVKPELEVFEMGHLRQVVELAQAGAFEGPVMVQLCLGIPYAAPATTTAMFALQAMLPRAPEFVWSAFGIGAMQMPMVAQAVILGGNVRVGLEDNLYLSRGVLATNGQLVEKAVSIVQALGAEVIGPDRVRAKLGLPQRG